MSTLPLVVKRAIVVVVILGLIAVLGALKNGINRTTVPIDEDGDDVPQATQPQAHPAPVPTPVAKPAANPAKSSAG